MARFIYRLDNIKRLKEQIEEQKKNDLAIATREMIAQQGRLDELDNKISINLKMEKTLKKGSISINILAQYRDYQEVLSSIKVSENKKLEDKNLAVSIARQSLVKAVTERKTFEILKEYEFEAFVIEENKKQEQLIDEVVTSRISK